jgi:hypothetical protein
MFRVVCALIIATSVAACGGSSNEKPRNAHWSDKAPSSPRAAEKRVGGFTADERAAYKRGLAHIANTHQAAGSFTIAQVVDQEGGRERQRVEAAQHQRDLAAAERARREEAERNHDYCADADKAERAAADAPVGRRQYQISVAGLAANERCSNDINQLINKGYLLSFKAMSEHAIGVGDWRTDFNQANQLLVTCQTTPGLYGTKVAAQCETQEGYNIRASTQWEMDSYR